MTPPRTGFYRYFWGFLAYPLGALTHLFFHIEDAQEVLKSTSIKNKHSQKGHCNKTHNVLFVPTSVFKAEVFWTSIPKGLSMIVYRVCFYITLTMSLSCAAPSYKLTYKYGNISFFFPRRVWGRGGDRTTNAANRKNKHKDKTREEEEDNRENG